MSRAKTLPAALLAQMGVAEAAAALGVSPSRIRQMDSITEPQIIGRRTRIFDRARIEQLAKERAKRR